MYSSDVVHYLQRESHVHGHYCGNYSKLRLRPKRRGFGYRLSACNERYDNAANQAVDATTEPSAGPPSGDVAGQIKVDRSACSTRGNLYQIFVAADNPLDNAQNSVNNQIPGHLPNTLVNAVYVAVANNVSLTTPTYTFTDYKIFSCGSGSTCPHHAGLPNLFPALAVDSLGYVYAVWSDNSIIYYSFSINAGKTWSRAIQVNQGATVEMSNVFPWVAAEGNGHVAIAWYGADKAGNSNDSAAMAGANWNVYVAETVNGHAIVPVFTQSIATDHVNHTGTISTEGFVPNGPDPSLADFFQIAIDPTNHRVNVAYADNHAGTSVTYFTRQKQTTLGIQSAGRCAGTCHEAGGEGDEEGKHGGKAKFNFNHDGCNQQPGSASFSDPGSGVVFQSTQVTSASFDEVAHRVTLTGSGTDNGLPVAFTIVAVDSSLVSPGLFSITLSDGYSNSGNLLDGSITVY